MTDLVGRLNAAADELDARAEDEEYGRPNTQGEPVSERRCHYCETTESDLRPYGPGGSWVCFPCATSTPDREQAAHSALGALLDGAEAVSPTGVVAIGEQTGPHPFDPGEASSRPADRSTGQEEKP